MTLQNLLAGLMLAGLVGACAPAPPLATPEPEVEVAALHGTPYPWSIGDASSSGCIRMFQQDVIDLYERVDKGRARVTVLSEDQAGQGTMPPGSAIIPARTTQIPMAEAQTLQRMAEDDGLTLDMLLGGS